MKTLGLALSVFLCIGQQASANSRTTPPSIAAAAAASGGTFDGNGADFDLLSIALETAGLTGALSDPTANLTVLAPTDRAFIRTARDLGFTGRGEAAAWEFLVNTLTELGGGDPLPVLTDILTYHVIPDRYSAATLQSFQDEDNAIDTLLSGASVRFFDGAIIDLEPQIDNPRFAEPLNLRTGNGLIHAIDRVLLPINLPGGVLPTEPTPGTIAAVVAASGGEFDSDRSDYDVLLNGLLTADLLDAVGQLDSHLSVLAPNDAAFIRTARDLGYVGNDESGAWQFLVAALTDIGGGDPVPVLTNILLYHVTPVRLTRATVERLDRRDRPFATLLTGSTITVNGRNLIDADPDLPDPRLTDPEGLTVRNGTIQPISRVLIPLDL